MLHGRALIERAPNRTDRLVSVMVDEVGSDIQRVHLAVEQRAIDIGQTYRTGPTRCPRRQHCLHSFEILGGALKVEPSPTDWLFDVDPGFYCTEYLRSWAFEAQMRFHLCEKFGYDWFSKRQAGTLLRELWSLGQKPTADEMLADVTGAGIEMAAVAERAREML